MSDKLIKINAADRTVSRCGAYEGGHPLEVEVLRRIGERTPLNRIESLVDGWSLKLAVDLENDGLLSRRSVVGLDQLVGGTIALLVPLVGLTKIVVGLSRGKPVGILMLLTLIASGMGLVLAAWPRRRTQAGDDVVAGASGGGDLVRAVAVSGTGLLGVPAVSILLDSHKNKDDGGSSGGGGSWYGSGCGSGGGDSGGGGGCGGGCSGCSG